MSHNRAVAGRSVAGGLGPTISQRVLPRSSPPPGSGPPPPPAFKHQRRVTREGGLARAEPPLPQRRGHLTRRPLRRHTTLQEPQRSMPVPTERSGGPKLSTDTETAASPPSEMHAAISRCLRSRLR